MSTRRSQQRGRPTSPGQPCPDTPGRNSCMAWRARFRSMPGCWRSLKRWTTANRSAKRAISISRWWPAISTITPAGPRSWTLSCPVTRPLAWWVRSCRGTSRCSCSPGKSRRPSRPATPSCSSRPSGRRSRPWPSLSCATTRGFRRGWSTSSPATAAPAIFCCSTPGLTRSPLPGRPKSAATSAT